MRKGTYGSLIIVGIRYVQAVLGKVVPQLLEW